MEEAYPASGEDPMLSASRRSDKMYIEPIDEMAAKAAFPRRRPAAVGLFAWGRARPRSRSAAFAWLEFAFVFLWLPGAAIASGAHGALPLAFAVMLSATVALLSMTRSFHWRDLLPVDPFSEWRLLGGVCAGLAAGAALLSALAPPERLFAGSDIPWTMLIAFPIMTALPLELVYRALFFRRFGHLFRSERRAILAGAAATGLAYLMLSQSGAGVLFGAGVGALLGWIYLRTGQFALCVLIHWIAALALWVIGPGITAF